MSIVKAMAFLASAMSEVRDAKRGWSWFSRKEPKRLVSLAVDLRVLMPLARLLMLPEVDWNACVIQ